MIYKVEIQVFKDCDKSLSNVGSLLKNAILLISSESIVIDILWRKIGS
jgi:hypothetical protein